MTDPKVKDRSAKLLKKRKRMPVNGQSMKRLLVDRAAKAAAKCAAKAAAK